ncbi:MAG: Hint domain-containing protein [Rhodobacteraceae bacterium]|nr:Hint domain-containing protein [Paracoccaceae bacterium]
MLTPPDDDDEKSGEQIRTVEAHDQFENGLDGWVQAPGADQSLETNVYGGETVLGRFAGDTSGTEQVQKTYELSEGADSAEISFDFYKLDSWDNSEQWGIGESLTVYIDGEKAFDFVHATGAHTGDEGSFEGGSWAVTPTDAPLHIEGTSGWYDQVYKTTITLDDPDTSVTLGVGANLNQSAADESFAIDNVEVITIATDTGDEIIDGDAGDDGPPFDLTVTSSGFETVAYDGNGQGAITDPDGSTHTTTRGYQIRVYDEDGNLTDYGQFDTYGDPANADAMGAFLDDIPNGSYVAISTHDEPHNNVCHNDSLLDSLGRLGVDTDAMADMDYRGSMTFVGHLDENGTGHAIDQQIAPQCDPPISYSSGEQIVTCFTPGTLIATPDGERRVETLAPGDMVLTADHGAQTLRWIGRRTVWAVGSMAPYRIRAGTLDNQRDLLVSPMHRFLISSARAELLFGTSEVLVAAKFLADGTAVRACPGGCVTYLHLLFDQHEIIYAEGCATESFHLGASNGGERAVRKEIMAIFPELAHMGFDRYGSAARPCLRAFESDALLSLPTPICSSDFLSK